MPLPPTASQIGELREMYRRDPFYSRIIDRWEFLYEREFECIVDDIECHVPSGERGDAIQILKKLDEMKWGRFKVGRRQSKSRFIGHWPLKEIWAWARPPADGVRPAASEPPVLPPISLAAVAPPGESQGLPKMIEHVFHLRRDLDLRLSLPENLSAAEAARVAGFIQSLPF